MMQSVIIHRLQNTFCKNMGPRNEMLCMCAIYDYRPLFRHFDDHQGKYYLLLILTSDLLVGKPYVSHTQIGENICKKLKTNNNL